jgi:hypothetical protein
MHSMVGLAHKPVFTHVMLRLYTLLHRRPLKLTGWELWLCGETAGPLFAPDKDAEVAAFSGAGDSSEGTVTVVKKEVAPATNVDVDVLVKAGYRAAQIEHDLISQVRVGCYPQPIDTSNMLFRF